ncbi:MAG TPA: hypothetical protein VF594_00085 [Rubricoccaceae bacterium]|jgi:hypothetical protein
MIASQAFHALALIAAARTAAHAARQVADRRAGFDASEQQDAGPAGMLLAAAVRSLSVLLVRLRVRLAAVEPSDPTAALVQAFEGRLVLDDVAREARRAHQALLSLYPTVAADTIEEARRLALDAEALATADVDRSPGAAVLTADLAAWLDRFETAE